MKLEAFLYSLRARLIAEGIDFLAIGTENDIYSPDVFIRVLIGDVFCAGRVPGYDIPIQLIDKFIKNWRKYEDSRRL